MKFTAASIRALNLQGGQTLQNVDPRPNGTEHRDADKCRPQTRRRPGYMTKGWAERCLQAGWDISPYAGATFDYAVAAGDCVLLIRVVETESHVWVGRQTVLIDGQPTDLITGTRIEAARTQQAIGQAVQPVLVLSSPSKTWRSHPDDIVAMDVEEPVAL